LCGTKNRKGWDSCQNRSIPAEHLEAAVSNAVLNKFLTQDSVTGLVDEINAEQDGRHAAGQESLSSARRAGHGHVTDNTPANLEPPSV